MIALMGATNAGAGWVSATGPRAIGTASSCCSAVPPSVTPGEPTTKLAGIAYQTKAMPTVTAAALNLTITPLTDAPVFALTLRAAPVGELSGNLPDAWKELLTEAGWRSLARPHGLAAEDGRTVARLSSWC
ncbi:MAG: hypothetical protein NVS3B24_04080 [Candidatus Dormibacteria bacterium]